MLEAKHAHNFGRSSRFSPATMASLQRSLRTLNRSTFPTFARVFEASVYRHLRELARANHGVISFSRIEEGLEVDFVIRYPAGAVGIEVTCSTDAKPRKLARAAQAMDKLGIDRKVLIHGGLISDSTGDIKIVPLHQFLLTPERYAGGEK
jgi:predicted AAA+ superfamily ATPase